LNEVEFIEILLKIKSDNILNLDNKGVSSFEIAKKLNFLKVLMLFGIFLILLRKCF
jgi:hypothetical protein